jgi:hypothetical protein
MDSAVAATGENGVATPLHSLFSYLPGGSSRLRFQGIGFNAGAAKNGQNLVNDCPVPFRLLAGSRIVDQRYMTHDELPLRSFSESFCTSASLEGYGLQWLKPPFRLCRQCTG